VHPPSPDNEERRLLAEYQTATRFYSWAVSELARQHRAVSHDDYLKLQKVAADARDECERVRIAVLELRSKGDLR
jgi:hypothetical protein